VDASVRYVIIKHETGIVVSQYYRVHRNTYCNADIIYEVRNSK
jgi:hypothetical protein